MSKVSKIQQKREKLKELSATAKEYAEEKGIEGKVNDLLKYFMYDPTQQKEFKPLPVWNKEGYRVKKGESAFLFWGKPVNATATNESKEEEEYEYFPLSFLFSSDQVVKNK